MVVDGNELLDVCSLFTNVPIGEALSVIHDMLLEDESLEDRTVLSADVIADLLNVCLRSTHFCYKDKFYEQVEGAAMGSPVSAIVANLYMEYFEELALKSAPLAHRNWKRFVDDTFCIIAKGKEDSFLGNINDIRPSIKFTIEREQDGKLPFLDCSL